MDRVPLKEELRCVLRDSGVHCAMITGVLMILEWFAGN